MRGASYIYQPWTHICAMGLVADLAVRSGLHRYKAEPFVFISPDLSMIRQAPLRRDLAVPIRAVPFANNIPLFANSISLPIR